MFKPKIIFFDIDDTLYIKDEARVPESARRALLQLRQSGVITAIATGRSPSVLPEAVKALIDECGIELLVWINGQYIRYRNTTLADFPMQTDTLCDTAARLTEAGINHAFVSAGQLAVAREDAYLAAAARALRLPYEIDPEHYTRYPIYQMLAFFPPEQDDFVRGLLPPQLKIVRWHSGGVDILDKQGSKARGIRAALGALGLEMADAMAFGDGANDVEMLSAVGFGVAMGNAAPELKRLAKYVCPPIHEDGIERGLRELGVI